MAYKEDRRLPYEEEREDTLADPVVAEIESDDDDEKDPLIAAGDEEVEEKDWM